MAACWGKGNRSEIALSLGCKEIWTQEIKVQTHSKPDPRPSQGDSECDFKQLIPLIWALTFSSVKWALLP